MTTRSNQLINVWVTDAGFDIIQTISDNAGHYSVTLAKKSGLF